MRLVGLHVLLYANASCHVFRTSLEMGTCHANASCRSWRLVVFFERVLKWVRAMRRRLVGLVSLLCMHTSCRSSMSGIASSTFNVKLK